MSQQPPPYPQQQPYQQAPQPADTGSFGWAVLGFFIPIAGLILWLVWKDTKPRDSRQSRNGFIASIVVWVVVYVLIFIIGLIGAMAQR